MADREPGEEERLLLEQVRGVAERAVQFDREQQLPVAAYYYQEAARIMRQLHAATGNDSFRAYGEKYGHRAGSH